MPEYVALLLLLMCAPLHAALHEKLSKQALSDLLSNPNRHHIYRT